MDAPSQDLWIRFMDEICGQGCNRQPLRSYRFMDKPCSKDNHYYLVRDHKTRLCTQYRLTKTTRPMGVSLCPPGKFFLLSSSSLSRVQLLKF